MRIWYVNHYAVPKSVSMGGRAQYVASALSSRGHEVTVFAASYHHFLKNCGDSQALPDNGDSPIGYAYTAVPVPKYSGNNLYRFLNMFAFGRRMGKILASAKKIGQAPDIIIVSSPHPWAWDSLYSANAGQARMVFEERDIWPLSLTELLGVSTWNPIVLWMNRLMRRIYDSADALVSLLPLSEEYGHPAGVPKEKFTWIPNGVERESWERASTLPPPSEITELFRNARAKGRLAVLYAGAMGPPNALESLLDLAACGDATSRPYHFFLMGNGVSRDALKAEVAKRGIDFITFIPEAKREVSWRVMREADALFLRLRDAPNLYKYGISMNKLFDYLMAGRPIIQVLSGSNHPVADSGAGVELDSGAPESLDDALRRLAALSAEERTRMGRLGREYGLAHHDWDMLGTRYAELCERL